MSTPTDPRAPRLTALHWAAAALDPARYFAWRRAHDGDPFVVRFPRFGDVLFTGTPVGARDIFRAPVDRFEAAQPNPIAPMVGDASLILLDGEDHRRERALLMPTFHSQRVRAYAGMIRDSALHEISRWRPGDRVDSRAASRAITLRVILHAVFGIDGDDRCDEYSQTVVSFLGSYSGALMLAPALRRQALGLGPWAHFLRQRERIDELLTADIEHRKQAGDTDAPDVLGMLLDARYDDGSALDDAELCEQLRSLLVAGHETTATAVVWALFHLHRNPAVLERLLDELAAADDDPHTFATLPYLDAVCRETLRMHPPVPIVLRRLRGPLTVNGVQRDAGDAVGISLTLLHSDPEVWTNPGKFEPQRFLDGNYKPFEYAPFGGGHRRCIGAALADYEMRIVLATILTRVRLELPGRTRRSAPPIAVPHNIATGPRRPIMFDVVEHVA
jgi:cytochrome P450